MYRGRHLCPLFFYFALRYAWGFYPTKPWRSGIFVITKGVFMQKVSYMGNGETTEFTFNFPYFDNSNIVVTKNGMQATGYNIIGTSGGLDADIPFVGGTVVFEVAPTALDCIVIARQLPMARVADYQPLAQINPTTLNQDLNYLMEVIKDRKDELDELCTQYSEIADKESTETLLARITAIHNEIVEIDAKIAALGDVSTLRTDVTTNTNDITTLKGYDYVIESQTPTAQNNYTWYRKYKSGWVEQGGKASLEFTTTGQNNTVSLPVTMLDDNYTVILTLCKRYGNKFIGIHTQTTTNFEIGAYSTVSNDSGDCKWCIKGFSN